MKQVGMAKQLGTTAQWFCAVKNGRADAGKDLADALNDLVGGGMELWSLKKNRKRRRAIIEKYLAAFKVARQGVAK